MLRNFRNLCFVNTLPHLNNGILYDNFWNNYFLFILSQTINLLFWLHQLNFRKIVDCYFLLSLHLYLKAMWSRWNYLCKQLTSHCRIHQGNAMLCLSTPFYYTNTASSSSPQSNFSNIPCLSTPLPKRKKKNKQKYHYCKAEKIILVSLRLKSMLYVFTSIDPQRCIVFFFNQLYENLNNSITGYYYYTR